MLAHLPGKRPRFRREDNICALAAAFEEIKPLWPVILLEEACIFNEPFEPAVIDMLIEASGE